MYVIIGQGAAGTAAAFRLRELVPDAEITVVTEEKDSFYSRILLTYYVGGTHTEEDVILKEEKEFSEKNINCLFGTRIQKIIPQDHELVLEDGSALKYEKLLLATGAKPLRPNAEGVDSEGIYTLWTLDDARALKAEVQAGKKAAIIGGGFIGLKLALAFKDNGLDVTIFSGRRKRLMPNQLDAAGSAKLEKHLTSLGIHVVNEGGVEGFQSNAGRVSKVIVNGKSYACDFAVLGTGTKVSNELAADAGISVDRGIIVDQHLMTSEADIYAAGDCAQVKDIFSRDVVSATWPSAVEQGKIAAENMIGKGWDYIPYLNMNSVMLDGLSIISAGVSLEEADDAVIVERDEKTYRKAIFRADKLIGFIMMGDTAGSGVMLNYLKLQKETDQFAAKPEQIFSHLFSDYSGGTV